MRFAPPATACAKRGFRSCNARCAAPASWTCSRARERSGSRRCPAGPCPPTSWTHRSALATLKANITTLKVEDRTAVHRVDAVRFAEQLHPGQYDVAFADPPYASGHAARLVAMFRVNPFARIVSIEHPADQPIPGDDTRRYGDTAVTFIYAP